MTTYKHKDLKAAIQASKYYADGSPRCSSDQRIDALPVTLFQAQLATLNACLGSREAVAGMSARHAWNQWTDRTQIVHLAWLIMKALPSGRAREVLKNYVCEVLDFRESADSVRQVLTFDELRIFSGGDVPARMAAWYGGNPG